MAVSFEPVSTWDRPTRAPSSVARRRLVDDLATWQALRLHRDRYGVAEDIYLTEFSPVALADVIVDSSVFDHPRLLS